MPTIHRAGYVTHGSGLSRMQSTILSSLRCRFEGELRRMNADRLKFGASIGLQACVRSRVAEQIHTLSLCGLLSPRMPFALFQL